MRIKYTALVILSAVILSACGGDNSSTTNTGESGNTGGSGNTGDKNPNIWSNFFAFTYKENSQAPLKTIVGHQQITLVDGIRYVKNISGLNLNYLNQSGEPPLVAVTDDNLYKSGIDHPTYGDYAVNLKVQNPSPDQQIWIEQPLSATSKPATLEHTFTWKVIDLSGKQVKEYLTQPLDNSDILPDIVTDVSLWNGTVKSPYKLTYNDFYAKAKDKVFPSGSKCLQIQKVVNNKDYFYLNTFPINSFFQKDLENKWKVAATDTTYNFNNLQGMQGYLKEINGIQYGYTLIQGRHYEISAIDKKGFSIANEGIENCQNLNDIGASIIHDVLK